jgi:HlyD family secretion protein
MLPARTLPLLAVAALLALALASCEKPGSGDAAYARARVERGELVAGVSATGTLNPLITVQVGSQVSGMIHRLHADFNSLVQRGDLIAEIEPSLFAAERAQAEADLKSAEAARDRAEVDVRDTQRELARLVELGKKRVVSERELDSAGFAHEAARAELRLAEAAIGQRRAALERARVNLEHTRITAPIDGVVVSRDVDVGQTVAASLQAPTLFTIAQDLRQMQIETEVDEAFIGEIQPGQPVQFSVFAYPDRVFAGRLAQIRLNPTIESGVVKYNCIIHVENADQALKPGMTATVTIEVARRQGILKVPNAALRYVPDPLPLGVDRLRADLARGEAILWSPDGNGLRPLEVQTGLVGEGETEVRGEGIEAGMEVAVPRLEPDKRRQPRRRFRLF